MSLVRGIGRARDANAWLFPSSQNPAKDLGDSQLNKCITTVFHKTDLRIGGERKQQLWHPFRHTFAVTLLNSDQGFDLYRLSKILGHTSIALTEQHYAHLVLDTATQRAAEIMTKAYG